MSEKIIKILLLIMLTLCACEDSSQENPLGPTERVITVYPVSADVYTSDTVSFSAVGGTGSYSWRVSQPTIGSISQAGVFTPFKSGEATVICTDSQGLYGTAHVTVNDNVVIVTPIFATIGFNESITFTASGGVSSTYFWWAEPPSTLGTITQNGVFTSNGSDGSVTITATDEAGNVGTARLSIKGIPITVSPSAITVDIGNTVTFTASGGTGSYSWISSDTTVGTVSSSGTSVTFTALASGTTTITATDSDGATASATVTVGAGAGGIGTLIIVPSAVSLNKSGTYQFAAYGGQPSYVWNVDDPTIGIIDSNGLFTASTVSGSATVTVTDSLGSTDTATINVVAEAPVSISPSAATLAVDTTLIAVGTGGTGTYWWSSSDVNNATVSAQASPTATTTITIPVTAVSASVVTIYAIDDNGNQGTATITIQ